MESAVRSGPFGVHALVSASSVLAPIPDQMACVLMDAVLTNCVTPSVANRAGNPRCF